jgi:hypothetical protein
MKTNLCTGCNNQWRSELPPKYCPECGGQEHLSQIQEEKLKDQVMGALNSLIEGINHIATGMIGKDVVEPPDKYPKTIRFYYEIHMDVLVDNFEEMESISITQTEALKQKGYTVSKAGTTELEE